VLISLDKRPADGSSFDNLAIETEQQQGPAKTLAMAFAAKTGAVKQNHMTFNSPASQII
jgi:hypothetical protein